MARLDRATRSGTERSCRLSYSSHTIFISRIHRTGPGGPVEPCHDGGEWAARRSPDLPDGGTGPSSIFAADPNGKAQLGKPNWERNDHPFEEPPRAAVVLGVLRGKCFAAFGQIATY